MSREAIGILHGLLHCPILKPSSFPVVLTTTPHAQLAHSNGNPSRTHLVNSQLNPFSRCCVWRADIRIGWDQS